MVSKTQQKRRFGAFFSILIMAALPASTFAFRPLGVPIFCVDPHVGLYKTGGNHTSLADDDGCVLENGTIDENNDIWGIAEIDGAAKRFMGTSSHGAAKLTQKSIKVNPTQSIWVMEDQSIRLTVTFTAPKLLDELDAVARPINYITLDAVSIDGKNHAVKATMYSNGPWKLGSSTGTQQTVDFGSVGATPVSRHVCAGHNEAVTVTWLGTALKPWWNRTGNKTFAQVFGEAETEYDRLYGKCQAFDRQVIAEAMAAGDTIYADIVGQGYRQCLRMNKLVAYNDTTPWFFSLEGSSGDLIQTVDVVHPQSPVFLAYNPATMKMFLDPVFLLYESGRCDQSDPPPHDLGGWPKVNGCNNGYWVEEAGNMMLMSAAVCQLENSGAYAAKHWLMLSKWADWLRRNGLDPVSQNSTDDFSGSYPHSCLLSIKACLGIGCYVKMATMAGRADSASKYKAILDTATAGVIRRGYENGHFKKANDLPGTWSLKYNLAWDRALGLKVFADSIAKNEMKWYRSHINKYGVQLVSTETYTKSDWMLFAATITGNRDDFIALAKGEWNFLNELGQTCCAVLDWHGTVDGYNSFPFRGVVGGYFFELMARKCLGIPPTAARPVSAKGGTPGRHIAMTGSGAMIDISDIDGRGTVLIVDGFGRTVKRADAAVKPCRIALTGLPNGHYTVIIKDNGGGLRSEGLCIAK